MRGERQRRRLTAEVQMRDSQCRQLARAQAGLDRDDVDERTHVSGKPGALGAALRRGDEPVVSR